MAVLRDPFERFDLSDVFDERENEARLAGVMAVLALPALHCDDGSHRRREVEIEIDGVWHHIDGVSFDNDRVMFHFGANGHRSEFIFPHRARMPRWRIDARVSRRAGPRYGVTP